MDENILVNFNKLKRLGTSDVIHCKNKHEMETLYSCLKNEGFRNIAHFRVAYERYRTDTCYSIRDTSFGSKGWYEENGYHIIEFSDLIFSRPCNRPEFKDLCKYYRNEICIFADEKTIPCENKERGC